MSQAASKCGALACWQHTHVLVHGNANLTLSVHAHCCYCNAEIQSDEVRNYVLDTEPGGCSKLFAPSEQIRSLQLDLEGYRGHPEMKINGPAADQWACGIVMFQLLTGELPFLSGNTKPLPQAPASVVGEEFKRQWQLYEEMRNLHRQWVSTQQPDMQFTCSP